MSYKGEQSWFHVDAVSTLDIEKPERVTSFTGLERVHVR